MSDHTLESMQRNLAQVKGRYLSVEESASLNAMLSWATKYHHLRSTRPTSLWVWDRKYDQYIVRGEDLDKAIEREIKKAGHKS